MPEVCIDDDCACSTDLQCPASYYCDRQAQVCSPIECQVSRECDLGRICIQHLCVTDINADRDRDGVPDAEDSCPLQANPDQEDHDRDLIGDLCDPDDDNDQVPDYIDNCVFTYNPLQGNADADAEESNETELLGNACDSDTPGISIRGQLDLSLLPGADPTAARVYIGDRIEPIVVNPDGSFTAEVAATEPGRLKIQIRWLGLAALEDEITLPDRVELFQIETPFRLELLRESRVELRGKINLEAEEDASMIFVSAYLGEETLIDTCLTDERGMYVLSVPPMGPLLLKFSADGYTESEISLDYDNDESTFKYNGEVYNEESPQVLIRSSVELSVSVDISPSWLPRGQGVATVTVSNGLNEVSQVIESGMLRFNHLTTGTHQVEVRRVGFGTVTQLIELSDSEENHLDLTLMVSSLGETSLNFQGVSLSASQLNEIPLDGADLSGVILRDQDLCGLQMSGISLVGADLSGADLSGADLSGARLDNTSLVAASLVGAKLTGVSFFGANLTRARLHPGVPSCSESRIKTDLSFANFSGSLLEEAQLTSELPPPNPEQTTCDRAEYVSPNLNGVYWTAINLNRAQLKGLMLAGVNISGVSMRQADLTEACLQNTSIILSDLSAVNLSAADLSRARLIDTVFASDFQLDTVGGQSNKANFRSARLIQTIISGSNLTGADFRNVFGPNLSLRDVILSDTDFSNSKLRDSSWRGLFLHKVSLVNTELVGADMRYVQILESDLSGVDLERVNLSGASLNEVNLSGLNMKGVNLSNASLYGANLEDANLSNSIIAGDVQATRVIGTNFTFARYNTIFDEESGEWLYGTQWPTSFNPIYIRALGPESILDEVFFPEGFEVINADLTGASLGAATLNNVNFSDSNMTRVNFTFKSDFTLSTVVVPMRSSNFNGVNFTQARLKPVDASGSSFRGATFEDMNGESFSGIFNDADFTEARFIDVISLRGFHQSAIFDQSYFARVSVDVNNSSHLSFIGATLENVSFNSGIPESDFTNAALEDVTFNDDISRSNFTNTSLTRVTFESLITDVNFTGVDLSQVTFSDIALASHPPCPIFSPDALYQCDSTGIRRMP